MEERIEREKKRKKLKIYSPFESSHPLSPHSSKLLMSFWNLPHTLPRTLNPRASPGILSPPNAPPCPSSCFFFLIYAFCLNHPPFPPRERFGVFDGVEIYGGSFGFQIEGPTNLTGGFLSADFFHDLES